MSFFKSLKAVSLKSIALLSVALVAALVLWPKDDPSLNNSTPHVVTAPSVPKVTPIDGSQLVPKGLQSGEVYKSNRNEALARQYAAPATDVTVKNTQPIDQAAMASGVGGSYTNIQTVPFEQRPAVVAMSYYQASPPASERPHGAIPKPIPIEKIIEKRRLLAQGEVLY